MPSNHHLPGFAELSACTVTLRQRAWNPSPFPAKNTISQVSIFFLAPPKQGPPEERKFHLAQNQIYLGSLHNNTMKAQMIFPHLVALRRFSSAQE